MNELEWPILSYYVIYSEKFSKIMQRTEKEAFNQIHSTITEARKVTFYNGGEHLTWCRSSSFYHYSPLNN